MVTEFETTSIRPPDAVARAFKTLESKFETIVSQHPDDFPPATSEEKMKNRYGNILPPAKTRFRFNNSKTYINANYIGEKEWENRTWLLKNQGPGLATPTTEI